MRQYSLSTKLSVIILVAVVLPLVILALTSFFGARSIAFDNLEAFIAESGSRRQQAIENDLNIAFSTFHDFMRINEEAMASLLVLRQAGTVQSGQSNAERVVEDLFRSQLLQSGYFDSVSLITAVDMNAQGNELRPFATTSRTGIATNVNYDLNDAENIRVVAGNLHDPQDQTMAFVETFYEDEVHLEIIHAVYAPNEAGEIIVVGYLVADVNLQTTIIDNLAHQEGSFESYAYMILPMTNDVLATNQVQEDGLIFSSSIGANRARELRIGSSVYNVEQNGQLHEVLGYSSVVQVGQAQFPLVAEVDTSVVSDQLLEQALSRIFPLVIGITGTLTVLVLIVTNQMIVPPIRRLRQAILAVVRGNFDEPVPDVCSDEIGSLATSFLDMRDYVRNLTQDMDRKLRERTRDVQVTHGISRAVTAERDIQRLMNRVVEMIVENFPTIYHAQIFMIDKETGYAVLRASTGQAGQDLLGRGHKLAVGSVSVIGQVTEQGQVVVARDTAESDVHRHNEFLRETVAELAIPLQLGEEIIGALDVQSKQHDTFDADQVNALQTLADQVTIALENARLYAESERLLADIERERSATTRASWQQYMYQQRQSGLQKQSGTNTGYDFSGLNQAVYQTGKAIVGDLSERETIPFAVPIILRGQTLGVVEYEVPQSEFSYDKVLLAEELVSRMSISLENARLFQSSQQTIERERVVNEISSKLTAQSDIEDILQTAIREVGQALRTPQIAIRLKTPSSNGAAGNGAQHSPNGKSSEESSS